MSLFIDGQELRCDSYKMVKDKNVITLKLKNWTEETYNFIRGKQIIAELQGVVDPNREDKFKVTIGDFHYLGGYLMANKLNSKTLKVAFQYEELEDV